MVSPAIPFGSPAVVPQMLGGRPSALRPRLSPGLPVRLVPHVRSRIKRRRRNQLE